MRAPCSACGRDADLQPITSALDGRSYDICTTCVDHQAEPIAVIVKAVNEVGWIELPEAIRQAIRVYDMDEYVRVGEWAKRMSHRQLVPCEPHDPGEDAEDSGIMREILDKMDEIKKPKPSHRRGRFTIVPFLASLLFWRIPA